MLAALERSHAQATRLASELEEAHIAIAELQCAAPQKAPCSHHLVHTTVSPRLHPHHPVDTTVSTQSCPQRPPSAP
eukprot:2926528-Prymnesium_polylepis.1